MQFYIITNSIKDPGLAFTQQVCTCISERGCKVVPGHLHPEIPADTDFVIVLGGDGSVLQAAARLDGRATPILGINLGTLGYLAEIEKKDFEEAIDQLIAGNYTLEERMMLEGERIADPQPAVPGETDAKGRRTGAGRQNEEKLKSDTDAPLPDSSTRVDHEIHRALNDVVFVRQGPLRVENYDVYVNGQFLNSYNADGIILSTPTGSTAYNLSAGGPIVEPSAQMIVMTPICPHTLNNRSVVLAPEDVIDVRIGRTGAGSSLEAEADFDGSDSVQLRTGDCMRIRRSARTVTLAKLWNRSFLETLRRKFESTTV